ncbi:hypothetical protein [Bacillus benzoevorans]|uniref:Uncharacterized protein n=1 Tax=Bacillus benzoevorans TaxID=1456 RepID=A0A7X0HS38_9BACI|nr:hypothetical protein [Bacillus benzoevorans]MBB6445793.1 hypothetical protein [Bacillus benzoevorans]
MIRNKMGEQQNEVIFGGIKYIYKTDKEFDYLIDHSNNKVKVNLKFSKDKEKNLVAKNGLKTFFSRIS